MRRSVKDEDKEKEGGEKEREGEIKIDRELENMAYKGRGTQVEITTNRCIWVIQPKIH